MFGSLTTLSVSHSDQSGDPESCRGAAVVQKYVDASPGPDLFWSPHVDPGFDTREHQTLSDPLWGSRPPAGRLTQRNGKILSTSD